MEIVADDYVNRYATDVMVELVALRLKPTVLTEQGFPPKDPTTCVVTSLNPTGMVKVASAVRIVCDPQQNGPP